MADIYFSELDPSQAGRFPSSYWTHIQGVDERHLVVVTGVAIIDYKGQTSDAWRRDKLHLTIRFPTNFFPAGKVLRVDNWAPFLTINALYNKDQAINAGWAVDAFGISLPSHRKISNAVGIWADLAVCDSDGWLFRIGYTLTVQGVFDQPPPP